MLRSAIADSEKSAAAAKPTKILQTDDEVTKQVETRQLRKLLKVQHGKCTHV